MKLRTLIAASATTLLVGLSAPAYAVTATGTDPSGDTSVATNDITSLGIAFDHSAVTVTIQTAAALPALTDASWNKRDVYVALEGGLDPDLGFGTLFATGTGTGTNNTAKDVDDTRGDDGYPSENYGSFALTADGVLASSNSDHGDDAQCDAATYAISGTTLTMHAPAACFGNLGSMKVVAAISDGTKGGTDAAVTADLNKATSVDAAVPGGYYLLGSDGGVFSFGDAKFFGSTGALKLNSPVVAMSSMPTAAGYRFVAGDGGVFSYGDAGFYGSMGGKSLNKPIVGMTTTADGKGYYLVASDGGIFAYGDAAFYGSMGGKTLNKPIVAMSMTPDGKGYWMVASDGGIFAFGDAGFYGSMGGKALNKPIIGMASTSTGKGYMLVASDGGTFAYGDQQFYGSGVNDFSDDVVGVAPSAGGYHLVGANGDVFAYGPAYDYGDTYRLDVTLNKPLVGMAEAG